MQDMHWFRGKAAGTVIVVGLATVLMTSGPVHPSSQEATVAVTINVERFAQILTPDISVHLELSDRAEKTAYSDPITVQANAWFDAVLTVDEDQLIAGPLGGRFPFATGEVHGETILYSPKLRNGGSEVASWNRFEERTLLQNVVAPGLGEIKVGIESWMERTPADGLAAADTYRGTMTLTLAPSASPP